MINSINNLTPGTRSSSPNMRETNSLNDLKSKFESTSLRTPVSKNSHSSFKKYTSAQLASSTFHKSRLVFEYDSKNTRIPASSPIYSYDRQAIKNRISSSQKIEIKNVGNSSLEFGASSTNLNLINNTSWVNYKTHSSKCNIIIKKLRRGNKRSKSLPPKFNIDSLLDYLNTSMALNKYELKKLSQHRNLMLFLNNQQINNSSSSSSSNQSSNLNNNNNNHVYLNRLNRVNTNRFSNSQQHTSCSSGYNSSDNHSTSCTTITSNNTNTNFFNFYRLSLNHLPLNSIFLNTQCTCGATISSYQPLSSSPNIRDHQSDSDLSSEEDDELDELSIDEDIDIDNSSPDSDAIPKISIEKSDITINNLSFPKPQFQRAPGTSQCLHTARVDLRRVRSFKDLTETKLVYSQNDFLFREKLGEGFFANVRKIEFKRPIKSFPQMVLKELKLNFINLKEDKQETDTDFKSEPLNYAELNSAHKSFLKEAQVLRNLNHPNVIKMLGIMFTKEKHLNLILEYISGGTLKDIIHNINIPLQWKLRVGYARDIASAMQYLHSLNIIHRDLKSDNCLVRENGRSVVVADFGLSRIVNYSTNVNKNNSSLFPNNNESSSSSSFLRMMHNQVSQSPESSSSATNSFIVAAKKKLKKRGINVHHRKKYAVVGNSFSMAPEMLKHQIYDERVDIFSFGIICCEIIGRVQADPDYLPRTSDFGLNVELFRKKYCEPDCPKQFIKIAIACCELDPEKRPAFSKTHLWLNTILGHLQTNNPIPKNLLKNLLQQPQASGTSVQQLKL